MKEDFLHFLWQYQRFQQNSNSTSPVVQVLHPGYANQHDGPDFMQARLKIKGIEWAGAVEIHVKSSDWNAHQHHLDPLYNQVVLHVVWENDEIIQREDGSTPPCLELSSLVSPQWLDRYQQLVQNLAPIPCAWQFHRAPPLIRLDMLDKALVERLQNKAEDILERHHLLAQDWEEVSYQLLCKNFGFRNNSEAFEELAKRLPYRIILKHRSNLLQVEALLFGMAGLLKNKEGDNYYQELRKEFSFLKKMHRLEEPNPITLKFMRLRPPNFPTIRLAQLAQLIHKTPKFFSSFINLSIYDIQNLLSVKQSEYWLNHYHFGKIAKRPMGAMGENSIQILIVNTVSPLLAAYAVQQNNTSYLSKATQFLESIPPEENQITRLWQQLGWKAQHAYDSQGLIGLYKNYCQAHRCLQCSIGLKMMNCEELAIIQSN